MFDSKDCRLVDVLYCYCLTQISVVVSIHPLKVIFIFHKIYVRGALAYTTIVHLFLFFPLYNLNASCGLGKMPTVCNI